MNFTININLDNSITSPSINISDNFINDEYIIDLYLSPEMKFNEMMSEKNIFKMLKENLDIFKDNYDLFENSLNIIDVIINNDIKILDNCHKIKIDCTYDSVKYIENNKCLLGYDIYLNEVFFANNDDFKFVKMLFGKYENIHVLLNGNSKYIKLNVFEKTVQHINEIIMKIKKYNLSPLEQIMYAYDLVRNRVYTSENKNENLSVSRDLSSVLLGNKIVCVGYAALFEQILLNLDIKVASYTIISKENNHRGHQLNVVKLNDDKYNINGVFFFDPTSDSRKNDTNDYLDSYKFFCKNRDDFELLFLTKYNDNTFSGYNEETVDNFKDYISKNDIKKIPKDIILQINNLSSFIDGKSLINNLALIDNPLIPESMKKIDYNKIINKLYYYNELLYNSYIDPYTLSELLFNVRKVEFYENPEQYPFNIDNIKKVIVEELAFNNNFEFIIKSLNDNYNYINNSEEFNEINKTLNISKKIEQIKISKLIRNVYDDKKKCKKEI